MQSSICFDVNLPSYRGVEQLVARRAHNPKVVGSSPAPATREGLHTEGLFFCGKLSGSLSLGNTNWVIRCGFS